MLLKLRKLTAAIAIIVLSISSRPAFAIQGRGNSRSLCRTQPSDAELQAQNLSEISCKGELKALKCDEFFETDVERKEFERQCPPSTEERQMTGGDLGAVCLRQMVNPTIDSIKGVLAFIASGVEETEENRKKFIAACEKDSNFKATISKTIPIFANSSKDQIDKYSCDYLLVEFEDNEARQKEYQVNQRAKAAYRKYVSTPHTNDESEIGKNPFLEFIQHNKDKWKCLNQAGHYEIVCYGFFSVIDPTMLVGGVGAIAKGARLARLFGRAADGIGVSRGTAHTVRETTVKPGPALASTRQSAERLGGSEVAPAVTRAPEPSTITMPLVEASKTNETPRTQSRSVAGPTRIVDATAFAQTPASEAISLNAVTAEATTKTPGFHNAVLEAHKKLTDPNAWNDYLIQLQKDALADMRARAIPKEAQDLANGKISRRATLSVLVQRSKAAGDPAMRTVVGTNAENFFDNVGHPFFDNGFKYTRDAEGNIGLRTNHGVDSHLVQKDFLRNTLDRTMGSGGSNKFYQVLSRDPNGRKIWDRMFDGFASDPTSPEYLGTKILQPNFNLH